MWEKDSQEEASSDHQASPTLGPSRYFAHGYTKNHFMSLVSPLPCRFQALLIYAVLPCECNLLSWQRTKEEKSPSPDMRGSLP